MLSVCFIFYLRQFLYQSICLFLLKDFLYLLTFYQLCGSFYLFVLHLKFFSMFATALYMRSFLSFHFYILAFILQCPCGTLQPTNDHAATVRHFSFHFHNQLSLSILITKFRGALWTAEREMHLFHITSDRDQSFAETFHLLHYKNSQLPLKFYRLATTWKITSLYRMRFMDIIVDGSYIFDQEIMFNFGQIYIIFCKAGMFLKNLVRVTLRS